ncbi:hypothetical protein [Bradyrhizobium japonicum]|uniref:hypothetical protein n=1 Tax=Bradyrhizobium japonicum TaxID=375 RepID=UPI001BA8E922|nr:hypothetical protein [Bradyrhizobium japonicum]MBR0914546.1 hypothetical protein [Bradyrhizobium japonicum]
MRRNFTLPKLEHKLDELKGGTLVQISRRDYQRLFELNDAVLGRMLKFVPRSQMHRELRGHGGSIWKASCRGRTADRAARGAVTGKSVVR